MSSFFFIYSVHDIVINVLLISLIYEASGFICQKSKDIADLDSYILK